SETIPLHWNPDWEKVGCENGGCQDPFLQTLKSDVVYTQSLRWVSDHVIEMTMSVRNLSDMDHPETHQEFPTLYATYGSGGTPNLNVILSSTGVPIAVDEPANDGFFKKEFTSPGGWAALQNAGQTYGVGLYYENELGDFQAWQKDGVFNNFRSLFPFAIPAFGTVKGRAYLVLGGYGTIAGEVSALQTGLAPFGSVDSPQADQAIDGPTMSVSGWALDNRGVTEVRVEIDGVVAGSLGLNVNREDVCVAWPLYPGCPTVGFEGAISIAGFSPCPHLVEVVGVDTDGNERVIGRRRVYFGGAVGPQPVCGDGACSSGESPESCPGDCPPDCGDGACTGGEGVLTCPADCPPECGDGICSAGEDCEADCGGPQPTWETVLIHRYSWEHMGDSDHMFGTSEAPPEGYSYEGAAFQLYVGPGEGLEPLYQSYCEPCTDHLQGLVANEGAPGYSGHAIIGYCSPNETPNTPNYIQRVYSAEQSDHFMTANQAEVEAVQALGFVLEGGCWGP
ncbi:MAG: Ig-like domain-containing protein, partial [Myxococcota bacterium]|nr:Ig-like domain-containing protein [Myxococcota bacterium]